MLAAALAAAVLLSGCPAPSQRPQPRVLQFREHTLGAADAGSAFTGSAASAARIAPAARKSPLSRDPFARDSVTNPGFRRRSDGASSTLDRALRIEPNNPLLWIELGRLRLAESDARQAEACGRKALSLASGDRGTQAQAGRLLADALRAQRRNQEAVEIERQPFMR